MQHMEMSKYRGNYIYLISLGSLISFAHSVTFLEIRRIKSTNTAKEEGSKQTGTATKKQKQEMQE